MCHSFFLHLMHAIQILFYANENGNRGRACREGPSMPSWWILPLSAQKAASSGGSEGTLVQSSEREYCGRPGIFPLPLHEMCTGDVYSSYFSGGKSERSVSGLTHCGQAVVFTLDSNTQKDEYRSVHLCIAWAFGAFNDSLIRWETRVFTQSELRAFSRVIFKPLKGIPIWRCQLTALFKGLVHLLFANQAF